LVGEGLVLGSLVFLSLSQPEEEIIGATPVNGLKVELSICELEIDAVEEFAGAAEDEVNLGLADAGEWIVTGPEPGIEVVVSYGFVTILADWLTSLEKALQQLTHAVRMAEVLNQTGKGQILVPARALGVTKTADRHGQIIAERLLDHAEEGRREVRQKVGVLLLAEQVEIKAPFDCKGGNVLAEPHEALADVWGHVWIVTKTVVKHASSSKATLVGSPVKRARRGLILASRQAKLRVTRMLQ
jgi:hypothetical protein